MSDAGKQIKLDWVTRVLKVQFASGTDTPKPTASIDWSQLRAAWQTASDAVDAQISALQGALRQSGDEVLEEIAQFGMNGLTGNHKVRVLAGLGALGTGDADATKKASTRLLATIGSFRNHLDSDERIEVCDDNPLGVAVSIRATFGGALAEIEAKLLQAV